MERWTAAMSVSQRGMEQHLDYRGSDDSQGDLITGRISVRPGLAQSVQNEITAT
jgi:hypothetical protein